MARLIAGIIIFLAGAATGAMVAREYFTRATDTTMVPPVAASENAPVAQDRRGDGTVWVTLENGLSSQRALAIVIEEPSALLVRFDDFRRAQRGFWKSVDGNRRPLGPALALDLDLGLLAFAVTGAADDALALSAEDGALFLGRDVTLTASTTSAPAFVDSAAIEVGLNDYRYYLETGTAIADDVAAVTLPQSHTLVAMATRDNAASRWLAIDAGTLRSFLARPLAQPVASLAEFSDLVFRQPRGLAVEFDQLAAQGRWQRAIDRGLALLEADPERMTRARRELLYLSVAQLAQGLIATDRSADALRLIDDSVRQIGANEALLRVAANVADRARGTELAAIDYLNQLGERRSLHFEIDRTALATLTRERIAAFVNGDLPRGQAIELLVDALARDADYAVYHRLLGALLFDAGRYAEAEFHLRRAVDLDPQYAAEVAQDIETSRQRRGAGRQTVEAPLQAAGNGLYVNARLNDSAQTFRLLLDTGATYSAINTSTLLRLGLNDIFARGAPPIELETANGRIFAPSFALESVDVHGAVVQKVPVVLLEDMGPLDGLLGLSFLRHFDVQIDQRANKLLLTPR